MVTNASKPKEPEWRKKIQAGNLANRLMKFVNGEIELSAAQVTAALGLMKKVAPDLSKSDSDVKLSGAVKVDGSIKFIRPGN